MDNCIGYMLTSKQRLNLCICVLVIAVLSVSGDNALENRDSDDNREVGKIDFRNLWELYILPRLEMHLKNKLSQISDDMETQDPIFSDYDSLENYLPNSRKKRVGVAGLDNLDLMTSTLDRARHPHRFRRPLMSVASMSNSRLRNLMRSQGKRK